MRRARLRRGFTLLEVVVVFVILAAATAVAIPAWRQWFEEDDLTRATQRIEALFRLARDSAIHSGLPVTVVIDSVTGRVWLDSPPRVAMADSLDAPAPFSSLTAASDPEPGTDLELPPSIKLALTRARARFVFEPSGAAYADSLTLKSPLATRLVTVNPWTGDVITY